MVVIIMLTVGNGDDAAAADDDEMMMIMNDNDNGRVRLKCFTVNGRHTQALGRPDDYGGDYCVYDGDDDDDNYDGLMAMTTIKMANSAIIANDHGNDNGYKKNHVFCCMYFTQNRW